MYYTLLQPAHLDVSDNVRQKRVIHKQNWNILWGCDRGSNIKIKCVRPYNIVDVYFYFSWKSLYKNLLCVARIKWNVRYVNIGIFLADFLLMMFQLLKVIWKLKTNLGLITNPIKVGNSTYQHYQQGKDVEKHKVNNVRRFRVIFVPVEYTKSLRSVIFLSGHRNRFSPEEFWRAVQYTEDPNAYDDKLEKKNDFKRNIYFRYFCYFYRIYILLNVDLQRIPHDEK